MKSIAEASSRKRKVATESNASSSGGTDILGLFGVLFVCLKLSGIIDWSWWWVTLPFWGVPVILLAIVTVAFLVLVFLFLFELIRTNLK